ncbi:MAG: hypothetical protein Q9201_003970 [Fulgogasparrea decipioides]
MSRGPGSRLGLTKGYGVRTCVTRGRRLVPSLRVVARVVTGWTRLIWVVEVLWSLQPALELSPPVTTLAARFHTLLFKPTNLGLNNDNSHRGAVMSNNGNKDTRVDVRHNPGASVLHSVYPRPDDECEVERERAVACVGEALDEKIG